MCVALALILVVLVWVAHSPPTKDDPDANEAWDVIVVPNGTDTPSTTAESKEMQPKIDYGLDRVYKILSLTISGAILLIICIAAVVAISRGQPLDLENGPFAAPFRVLQQLRGYVDAVQERRVIRNLR